MEDFPKNQENVSEDNNNGTEMLSEMPAFEEHMKSFVEAKQSGEVPGGVRDERDYKEYQQEKEARLKEAQDFITKSYSNEKMSNINPGYSEEIARLANSENLKSIVEHGFSLEAMYKNGVICTHGESVVKNHIYPHIAQSMALDETKGVIDDLANFCDFIDSKYKSDHCINLMREAFNAYSNNALDAKQYCFIQDFLPSHSTLYRKLMYGLGLSDGDNPFESHTSKLMQEIPNIDGTYGSKIEFLLGVYKIKNEDESHIGVGIDTSERLESEFGNLANDLLPDLIDAIGTDRYINEDIKSITKSVLSCYDDGALKMAKNAATRDFDDNGILVDVPVFSDEELLGSIYDLKNIEIPKKAPEAIITPSRYLARHIGRLEKIGFSRNSLLKIAHDNDVVIGAEEIERMKEAGLNDAEIAYAGNAYKHCCIVDSERKWSNKAFAGFSDTDLLNAAIMDSQDRED